MDDTRLDPLLRITPRDSAPSVAHPLPGEPASSLDDGSPAFLLSVILPARDEAAALPACLASLLAQSDEAFLLGRDWQLILVDDDSTDATPTLKAQAATTHPGVTVLKAPPLDPTWITGKNNACWAGAQAAQGRLLLFTDADTIHEPGSLSRARHELEKYQVALLSYSPRQLITGLLQRITMPLIFAELAIAYPPAKVSDPATRIAAANGQFLMVQAEPYFDAGGHKALGRNVLEDVQLAHNIKRARNAIRFRYAPDALSTRMYTTIPAFLEGWTKNLALLFGSPVTLALLRLLDLLLIVGIPLIAIFYPFGLSYQRVLLWIVWARVLWRFYARAAKSNFAPLDVALSILGLPVLIFLLLRSYLHVRIIKSIAWKGRTYRA